MEIVIPPFAQPLYDNSKGETILKYPHEALRRIATPITRITGDTQKLIDRMLGAMRKAHGVGLAAPQVGSGHRLIIVAPDDNSSRIILNPEITEFSEETELGIEGCLSIPSLYGEVERSLRVMVSGLNRRGKAVRYELEGLPARVAQHEVDHLDGVLFIDRVLTPTLHWNLPEDENDRSDPVHVTS